MASKPQSLIPWRERPRLAVREAAEILAVSPSQIYALARTGKIDLLRDANSSRTFVSTQDVTRMLDAAAPWVPGGSQGAAARAAWRERTARPSRQHT